MARMTKIMKEYALRANPAYTPAVKPFPKGTLFLYAGVFAHQEKWKNDERFSLTLVLSPRERGMKKREVNVLPRKDEGRGSGGFVESHP